MDQLPLHPGNIDVWVTIIADMPDAVLRAQFDQNLTEDERMKRGKFHFEKDRRRYIVTRLLARYVLSRYVPIKPADWHFEATSFGRPVVANTHPGVVGMTFNISHSDDIVVLGVTRGRDIGIDVENTRRNPSLDVAESFFSASEVLQLRAMPPDLQPLRFLDFWTLKESYIKARGKGLSLPLDLFGFDLSGDGPLHAHFDASFDDAPRNWTFWQWRPSPHNIAALCVGNRPGVASHITVRRVLPFVCEENTVFDVLRKSA
ncbi:4'-phosphopantetheinyl transferase superfamily protein [Paraburkholderia sp. A1RI_3L]|uniref:4'-phosphopantetheinyl transferase family protein n=1 Tax=Paraburkholderia TaxID=1822464 RepID=UPI003B7BC93B